MKSMLMMNTPRGDGGYAVMNWKPENFQAHMRFMMQFNQELREAGELVGCEGLAPPRVHHAGCTVRGTPTADASWSLLALASLWWRRRRASAALR